MLKRSTIAGVATRGSMRKRTAEFAGSVGACAGECGDNASERSKNVPFGPPLNRPGFSATNR